MPPSFTVLQENHVIWRSSASRPAQAGDGGKVTGPVPPTPGTSWAWGPQGQRSTVHATLSTEIRAVPAPFSRTGVTFSVDSQEPMTPKAKNHPSRTVALYSRHTDTHKDRRQTTQRKRTTCPHGQETNTTGVTQDTALALLRRGGGAVCRAPRPAPLPPRPVPAAAGRTASGPSARLAPAS